jgi:hypothetical protein
VRFVDRVTFKLLEKLPKSNGHHGRRCLGYGQRTRRSRNIPPIALFPALPETNRQTPSHIASTVFPSGARCEALTWKDVWDGPLHTCQSIYCSHWIAPHSRKEKCWRSITDSLFTETRSHQNHREYVEKPEALDFFGGTYLCVDVKLLVALILCSVSPDKSISWREGAHSYDDEFSLNIRTVGEDLLVAHFRGHFKEERVQYTKNEITALMDGYPPWYREQVVCSHGPTVPFPIHSTADFTRGGWVVAVGLRDSNRKPMALYIVPNTADQQNDGGYFERTNGLHLRTAVQRVYDTLVILQTEYIQDSEDLDSVVAAVQYMIQTGTGSGVERKLPGRTVSGGAITQLDAEECKFAMKLFNGMVWTDADIQTLRPILAPVLQAAFNGCYEVVQYLKDTGMRLVLPHSLGNDWSRNVYLRDCVVDRS